VREKLYACSFCRYQFSVDLSSALPYAEVYPLEFALTNFIYWHSRESAHIIVLQDHDDIFGTSAMYCNREVLIAPYPTMAEEEKAPILKAYDSMGLMMQVSDKFFEKYPKAAKFATISQLVRNTRSSADIDVYSILDSQTRNDKARFERDPDAWSEADLPTPCKMVKSHTP
jgi:hypothetical protein